MSSIAARSVKTASHALRAGSLAAGRGSYAAIRATIQARLAAGLALLALLFAAPAFAEAPLRVLAFGDSLTAGYQLPAEAAFPAQLERRLRGDGFMVDVVNAGVSGDTTAGGLARLDFTLGDKFDLVILELGANDMLRGVEPKLTRQNLEKMLDAVAAKGPRVLLAGMRASNNFGREQKAAFDAIYPDLAKERGLPLYPFFLAGVAGEPSLVQKDGLHPTAEGVARIVAGVAPMVEDALRAVLTKAAPEQNAK